MEDVRCKCGKLLMKAKQAQAQIKCTRCGLINDVNVSFQESFEASLIKK